jgi:Arc/MetJ-type ribon-helix-helix transcriptional regulator
MRQVNVWLPEELHGELVRLRDQDRIGLNEAIRLALRTWLARRKRRERL